MGVEAGSTKDDFSDFFHQSIYQAIVDKRSTIIGDPGQTILPQIATSSSISPHIHSYLYWVKLKLTPVDCISSLYECGERLNALNERKAAITFYEACIATVDEKQVSSPNDSLSLLKFKVQSLFGIANADVRTFLELDPMVKYPNTLRNMLRCLKKIQYGMELVIQIDVAPNREKYSYLILNGSTHLFALCDPLTTLGYSRQVVEFFTWSILSLEVSSFYLLHTFPHTNAH
tara:strand:+ start:69 stop:761 length:693 start_codon:yes stop_codon:yes gene_type:complete